MSVNEDRSPLFTADVQMRLVIRERQYIEVGALMDELVKAARQVIANRGIDARFDFTGFNTHPCKAAVMSQLAHSGALEEQVYDSGDF